MKGVLSQRQKFDYISSSAEGLERGTTPDAKTTRKANLFQSTIPDATAT